MIARQMNVVSNEIAIIVFMLIVLVFIIPLDYVLSN